MGDITVTVSDPTVAKASVVKNEYDGWDLVVEGLKRGKVKITIKANGAKKTMTYSIVTQKEYDSYNDEDSWDDDDWDDEDDWEDDEY